jgi:hypothetical protein
VFEKVAGGDRQLPGAWVFAVLMLLVGLMPATASAEVTYGTLSNFDVINDTGEETHGFEIELDDVSSSDISYEFGAPYERYGNPKLVDFPGGVYVRYESPYDAQTKTFTAATPVASSPIAPTLGHQCWTGGSSDYLTSGCEHFGLGLNKNPTKTVYRWLVADQAHPGNLQASGTSVSLPAPQWSVQPPAGGGAAPGVRAVVDAPEPDGFQEFGEAQWVKVYETESPQPADLNHLLTDDPAVPQEESQTEVEWILLQKEFGVANGGELASEKPLGQGAESVTRRYELYEYAGSYDPGSHEARPAINDNTPAEGEIGEYVGAQMAALNILGGEPAPSVGKVSAKKGPAAGGTTVTVTGSRFTAASAVRFGSTDASSYKVNSPTSITAVSPPGTSGAVHVTVVSPNGTSAAGSADAFKYGNPTITAVTPPGGPKGEAASVTVEGSGFAPGAEATTFKFGKAAAWSVECLSTTTCLLVAPPAAKAGTVDLRANVGKAASKKVAADRYSYS